MSVSKQSRDHLCQKMVDAEVKNSPSKFHGKNPAAVLLGRLGGLKGGPARAAALSPERRKQIAVAAWKARWKKQSDDPKT